MAGVLAVLSVPFLLTGCNSGDNNVSSKTPEEPPTSQGTGMPPTGDTSGQSEKAPAMGMGQAPKDTASLDEKLDAKPLKEAQPAYDSAKKAFDAAPKDAKAKEAYIKATNSLADSTMLADELPPKVKYPGALKIYREVLKADPNNKHAKIEEAQIVSIYKSMGREVPGGAG